MNITLVLSQGMLFIGQSITESINIDPGKPVSLSRARQIASQQNQQGVRPVMIPVCGIPGLETIRITPEAVIRLEGQTGEILTKLYMETVDPPLVVVPNGGMPKLPPIG